MNDICCIEGKKMRKVGGFCLKIGCFLCYLISN